MNRKGAWEGPVVSFPPSFARIFSSKERRLGTRQVAHACARYPTFEHTGPGATSSPGRFSLALEVGRQEKPGKSALGTRLGLRIKITAN